MYKIGLDPTEMNTDTSNTESGVISPDTKSVSEIRAQFDSNTGTGLSSSTPVGPTKPPRIFQDEPSSSIKAATELKESDIARKDEKATEVPTTAPAVRRAPIPKPRTNLTRQQNYPVNPGIKDVKVLSRPQDEASPKKIGPPKKQYDPTHVEPCADRAPTDDPEDHDSLNQGSGAAQTLGPSNVYDNQDQSENTDTIQQSEIKVLSQRLKAIQQEAIAGNPIQEESTEASKLPRSVKELSKDSSFSSIVLRGLKKCISDPPRASTYLKQKLNEWNKVELNVAVTGNSGVGKSTFINTIRGLRASNKGAAPVGTVETTKEVKSYDQPGQGNLVFWDLPGVGTPRFPRETYMQKVDWKKYDFFLILASNRFTETDIWLAEEVHKAHKRFFFVRTRINSDLENERLDYPDTYDEAKVLANIRDNCTENLSGLSHETRVFLIGGRIEHRQRWDFPELSVSLVTHIDSIKRQSMGLSMVASSREVLEEKYKELEDRIHAVATISAVCRAPLPAALSVGLTVYFDKHSVSDEVKTYIDQMNLTEDKLSSLSDISKIQLDDLKKILDSYGKSPKPGESVPKFIERVSKSLKSPQKDRGEAARSFLKSLFTQFSEETYDHVKGLLEHILNNLMTVALAVFAKVEDALKLQSGV